MSSQTYASIALALLLSLLAILSLPILHAGYYSDDIINSLTPGTIKLYHLSFWASIDVYMKVWLNNGRFFPLSIVSTTAVFNYFSEIHQYQGVRLLFIWASTFSFAWLIRLLTRNTASCLLFLLFFPLCWSVHDVPDALVSFAVFLPLVVLFSGLTLITLYYYFATKKSGWLATSLIFYLLDLSCYEVGLMTVILVFILILYQTATRQEKFQAFKPYVIMTVIYLVTCCLIQHSDQETYNGLQMHLGSHFLTGFFAQATSALPLSYYFLAAGNHLDWHVLWLSFREQPLLALYLFSGTTLLTAWLLPRLAMTQKNNRLLLQLGLTLLIFPALLMGINLKYQLIISMGRGYIPVYVEYIGVAILLLSAVTQLERYSKRWHVILALLLGFTMTAAWLTNHQVVQQINASQYNTRALMTSALSHHLLDRLPDNPILVEKRRLWNPRDYFAIYSNKPYADVVDISQKEWQTKREQKYYLEAFPFHQTERGFVILGKIEALHSDTAHSLLGVVRTLTLADPWVFINAENETEHHQIVSELATLLLLAPEQVAALHGIDARASHQVTVTALTNSHITLPITLDCCARKDTFI